MQNIHLKAPKGWINDPNGFIFYKGKYHLFYQHFPYAPVWGRMHWGHAVSNDLTNWEHHDIALFPSKTDDCDGCFSGSTIEKDGRMHLFYTGVRYDTPNPENINCCIDDKFTAAQLHIASENGFEFDNFNGKKTVVSPIEDKTIGDINHTRDPKVWQGKDGNYYMVLGSTVNNQGRLLFYKSNDLESWEYSGFAESENLGWMWECPDYFEVNGNGVLVFSPMGIDAGNQAVCTFAEFDEKNCTMNIDKNYSFFDYGLDLYAPQSTVDADGRRVVIAWLRMPESMNSGTIGIFSIPRVCESENNHIYFRPHPNVRAKFSNQADNSLMPENHNCMIKAKLENGESLNIGGYIIRRENDKIITDRSAVFVDGDFRLIAETPVIRGGNELEIYVDSNLIEIFVNNGEYVLSNAVYGLGREISGTEHIVYTC